jgi:hypothetical protein
MSQSPFASSSRYASTPTATFVDANGHSISYLRRRFVPQAEEFVTLELHTVTQGERLDNIAAEYLGDSEQFWKLCDANDAIRPEELTESAGTIIRITLPQGMPGVKDA